MKNRARTKLGQRRGASIVIALVIFLLCALAGASAFFMASSNAGRYSHADEQQYYSASSAALMFVDMVDGLTYTSGTVTLHYERSWEFAGDAGAEEHNTTEKYELIFPSSTDVTGSGRMTGGDLGALTLQDAICAQCASLVPYLDVPDEWYSRDTTKPKPSEESIGSVSRDFTVAVDGESKFGMVNGRLVMNANYDLILTFNGGNKDYAITVYWPGDAKVTRVTEDPSYVYATPEADKSYRKGSMTQRSTLVVEVIWNKAKATISRGEAIQ